MKFLLLAAALRITSAGPFVTTNQTKASPFCLPLRENNRKKH